MSRLLLLYFLFLLLSSQILSSSFSFSNSTKLCPHHQTLALLHLKQSFSINNSSSLDCHAVGVTSYPKTESWKKGSDCCSWDGVTCDWVTGHVIELDLSCSWLFGTIHSNTTLFLLPHIQRLNLAFNNFSGSSISVGFGRFSSLTHLNLSDSGFSGLISPEISHLSNLLQKLHLGGISISSNNSLTENLISIGLSNNHFSVIPSHVNEFLFSKMIDLSMNELHGPIPSSIFKLIESIDLSNNKISGVWSWNMGKDTLWYLNLSYNSISGGGISPLICKVSSIRVLDLSSNNLSGMLPHCLGNFSKDLSVLNLRRNRFHGTIPQSFLKGNVIRNLDFNDNRLEGLVPRSLIICRKLEVLNLGNNKINDTFPHWLGTLPELQVLVLRSNSFHGHIGCSKLKSPFMSLRIIDLAHNDFEGDLPEMYLRSLKVTMNVDEDNMTRKYMGGNYYEDSVMVTIKGLEIEFVKILNAFATIDLSSNKFQGEIPQSIGNLNSLRGLNLSHNNLTGHIPSSFGNLKLLESLDLSSNKLIGSIPQQLTSLIFLEVLNLSQNHLTGFIPKGNQFDTFGNDSYNGNSELCGFPLSKKCIADETPEPSKEEDAEFENKFDWKFMLVGYGCGLVYGLSLGGIIFLIGKPKWFEIHRPAFFLEQSFSINNSSSSDCHYNGVMSYPKTESWKKGSDCCSWDGVAYDKVTGHVIGLDLGCSWLFGIIHSNSTLFLFPHLRRLNLASNDFNGFSISTGFGRFSTLTRLNLSYYVFSGKIAPEIFHLSNLFHFIYLGIIEQNLPRMTSILWIVGEVGAKIRVLDFISPDVQVSYFFC
ncbi:unnamed protein product, partial [Vitis vinifera]